MPRRRSAATPMSLRHMAHQPLAASAAARKPHHLGVGGCPCPAKTPSSLLSSDGAKLLNGSRNWRADGIDAVVKTDLSDLAFAMSPTNRTPLSGAVDPSVPDVAPCEDTFIAREANPRTAARQLQNIRLGSAAARRPQPVLTRCTDDGSKLDGGMGPIGPHPKVDRPGGHSSARSKPPHSCPTAAEHPSRLSCG